MVAGWRRAAAAEFAGTAMLLCAVIGSGIMAERLAGGNMAVALLANTLATVFALLASPPAAAAARAPPAVLARVIARIMVLSGVLLGCLA